MNVWFSFPFSIRIKFALKITFLICYMLAHHGMYIHVLQADYGTFLATSVNLPLQINKGSDRSIRGTYWEKALTCM
jgi:hypothetical protein